jgi:hypothetical protein
VSDEIGAFATVSYERFRHPTRGSIMVCTMKLKSADARSIAIHDTCPERLSSDHGPLESQGCGKILIPHTARGNSAFTGPLGAAFGSRPLEGWWPEPRQRSPESR